MKIGIDIDEVIVRLMERFLKAYERKYGRKVKFEEVYSYTLEDVFDLTTDEVRSVFNEVYYTELFEDLDFIEGAKEAIKKLAENHEVCLITSRPHRIKKHTFDFIDKHFSDVPLKIFFSKDFSAGGHKDEVCEQNSIEIMIEDHFDFALACANKGVRVFLMDKPWNQGKEDDKVKRVYGWNDILEEIE